MTSPAPPTRSNVARPSSQPMPPPESISEARTRASSADWASVRASRYSRRGGIRSDDDLGALDRVGAEGAIVGRALLEGHIDLTSCLLRPWPGSDP